VGAREYDPRTGRWLQRDPIEVAFGDPNLYRYCGNDPLNAVDPSGLDWLDTMANFWAGVGDSLTFGLTDRVRDWLGVNDAVDKTSVAYRAGEYTEVGAEILLTGGSKVLVRKALQKGAKRIRSEALAMTWHIPRNGKQLHHINPLLGHPGGKHALFPLGGLNKKIHSGWWNLRLIDRATHKKLHRRMKRLEDALRWHTNRYTIPARTLNNLRRDLENTEECP